MGCEEARRARSAAKRAESAEGRASIESILIGVAERERSPTDHVLGALSGNRIVGASPQTWESDITSDARAAAESPETESSVRGADDTNRGLGDAGKITTPVFSLSEGTTSRAPSSPTQSLGALATAIVLGLLTTESGGGASRRPHANVAERVHASHMDRTSRRRHITVIWVLPWSRQSETR